MNTTTLQHPIPNSFSLAFTNFPPQKLPPGVAVQEFPEISSLACGISTCLIMGIDFNDTTQPAQFSILTKEKKFSVSITAPVGELLMPNTLTENDFTVMQGMYNSQF